MRIAVVGAGAVGTYFGARFAADGHQVTLLGRGEQVDALREEGVTLKSELGDLTGLHISASDDPHGVGPVDVVLLTVRSSDLPAAINTVGLLIDDGTAVLPIQKHIEAADDVAAAIGEERVAPAFVEMESELVRPGRVEHRTPFARLTFGELNGEASHRLAVLEEACRSAGIEARLSTDIRNDIWRAWAFHCAFDGLTALTRRPVGTIIEDGQLLLAYREVLAECIALARSCGAGLDESDVEEVIAYTLGLPQRMRSGMLNDLLAGRPLELEALNGYAVRRGGGHGLPMSANRIVHAGLKPLAAPYD